jgi:hypothetical protein
MVFLAFYRIGGAVTRFRLLLLLILLSLLSACAIPNPTVGEGLPGVFEGLLTETPLVVEGTPTPVPEPVEGPTEASPTLELRTLSEEHRRPSYYVFSNYPYLAGSMADRTIFAFNQAVEGKLLTELALFKNDLPSSLRPPFGFDHPSTFLSGYQIHTATRSLVSLEMDLSIYLAGAAHPLPSTLTVTFSLDSGQALTLADLFVPGAAYLDRLAELAQAQLTERGSLLFEEGLTPTAENFQHWVLNPQGLTLIFDVYQVTAYAEGPQRVTIPFDQLADLLAGNAPPPGLSADPLDVERMLIPIQSPDQDSVTA